jgi:branched-chain amino acid aminotransferase
MDQITGKYYIIDNMIFESEIIKYSFNNSEYQFYEVLRIAKGVILFLDDHLKRLQDSLISVNLIQYYNDNLVKKYLYELLLANNFAKGNIKFICKFFQNRLNFAAYYIPHSYPEDELYTQGIKLKSYLIERSNPNLKQIHINELIKSRIKDLLNSGEFYEVLLVNSNNIITEGSRSNFFLIKEDTVFSAPENYILKGITRKYILQIIKELKLNYIEKEISIHELSSFDAAFISGTSPKVLPVRSIDRTNFELKNYVLSDIMMQYNLLFEKYIENNNQQFLN